MNPSASLPDIAGAEFERRRATATRRVAAGELSAAEANAHLLPWLAIACRAGADLTEFAPDVAQAVAELRHNPVTADHARAVVADELCSLSAIRSTLAAAREAALERAERPQAAEDHLTRARGLCVLATAFNVPMHPRPAAAQPEQVAA